MAEMRRAKRRHLLYYLKVYDVESGNLLGHVADITTQGVNLLSDHTIELNRRFLLRIELPKKIGDLSYLELEAESRWTQEDINPEHLTTGFRLLAITPLQQERIETLIEEYGFMN